MVVSGAYACQLVLVVKLAAVLNARADATLLLIRCLTRCSDMRDNIGRVRMMDKSTIIAN
jgi:hypothetical protein